MAIRGYLDKIGALGSIFTALCCLGVPAPLSILSAIGLGFLINDAILLPLLVAFLVITVVGLISGRRHHGKPWALIVGVLSSLVVVGFLFIYFNPLLVAVGIGGLILASLLNVWLQHQQEVA